MLELGCGPGVGIAACMRAARLASVVAVDAEDHRIEVGVIGFEGMTGVPLVMGDVIHAVNGMAVHSVVGLQTVLDSLGPDEPVVLQVERGGVLRYLSAPVH